MNDDWLICLNDGQGGIIGHDRQGRLGPMTEKLSDYRHLIEGRTVLDLGSNAGHFPIVLRQLGAKYVTAVEGRKCFQDFARRTLRHLFPAAFDGIHWITSDVRKFRPDLAVGHHEIVTCFGLIYHVPNGWEHLRRIVSQSKAELLFLDTQIFPDCRSGKGWEISVRSLKTCLNWVSRVPHPTIGGAEKTMEGFGWRPRLLLKDWLSEPGTHRALWLVEIRP